MPLNYIEFHLEKYPSIFKKPVDVVSHLLTVLGNGVSPECFDPTSSEYIYTLDIDRYLNDGLKPDAVSYVYEYAKPSDRFCVFMEYLNFPYPESVKKSFVNAFIYLLDCIEITTEEGMFERMIEQRPASVSTINRCTRELSTYLYPALVGWKDNINELRGMYENH